MTIKKNNSSKIIDSLKKEESEYELTETIQMIKEKINMTKKSDDQKKSLSSIFKIILTELKHEKQIFIFSELLFDKIVKKEIILDLILYNFPVLGNVFSFNLNSFLIQNKPKSDIVLRYLKKIKILIRGNFQFYL